jgi:tetratricopeptide (TPR) repeat protein
MTKLATVLSRATRGLLVAGVLGVALVTSQGAYAQAQTSAEFSEKYNAGVTAYKGHDLAKALASAKEAHGVAKSGFEKTAALKLLLVVAGASGKVQDQQEALEQLLNTEGVSAAEKVQFHKSLAPIYAATNHYDKAVTEMKSYLAAGAGSPSDWELLAQLQYGAHDCKGALESIDKASPAGKDASESVLKLRYTCYSQGGDKGKTTAVAEELLRRFPAKQWFQAVLADIEAKKPDDLAMLGVLRYGYERDFLADEGDYTKLADLALSEGTTAEAQHVLEKAFSKKVIGAKGKEKAEGLLKQAKDRATEDAKTLAQLDAESKAGKNGETDVKVGLRYFSMGQYDKAADALARGLSADHVAKVRRPDEANLVLGIVYTKIKKKAEADKAFAAAKADPRMAVAAKLWAGN